MDSSGPFPSSLVAPKPRTSVYVVHSDRSVVDEVRQFLIPRGWDVRAFKTSSECLAAIGACKPDLVICELEYSQGATVAGRLLWARFDVPCLVLAEGEVGKFADLAKLNGQPSGLWTVVPRVRGPGLHKVIVDSLLARLIKIERALCPEAQAAGA